jgi:hypothetical protein
MSRPRVSRDNTPGASAKSAAAHASVPTFQSLPQAFTGSKVTARTTRVAGARKAFQARAEAKNLTFDMKSRIKIQRGIDKLADAVAVTLGPRGTSNPITVVRREPSSWVEGSTGRAVVSKSPKSHVL